MKQKSQTRQTGAAKAIKDIRRATRKQFHLMFCLFAEDTAIFEKDLFQEFVETRTHEDGTDLGPKLNHLFEVLDTPENSRQSNLHEASHEIVHSYSTFLQNGDHRETS